MILGLTQSIVVLDAETGSPTQLGPKGRGASNYWADPRTRVFMFGWKKFRHSSRAGVADFEARNDKLPPGLIQAVEAPPEDCLLAAYNSEFDREALARLGHPTPQEKWLDIQTMAYTMGFSGRLADVLKQIGLGVAKHEFGQRCITYFSSQMNPWHSNPELWGKFREYCADDAFIEEILLEWLVQRIDVDGFRESFHNILRQDRIYQRINARGIPADPRAVAGAQRIMNAEKEVIQGQLKDLTGLDNPNSRDQLKGWLNDRGCEVLNLQKDTVRDEIEYQEAKITQAKETPGCDYVHEVENRQLTIRVLKLRQDSSKTSTSKYDAMARNLCPWDMRIRNGWQFYGASRTGRVAGRVINPANLARPMLKDQDATVECMAEGNRELLMMLYPEQPVLTTLSWCIRASLKAPEGELFTVADLTSIESVGLAWLAGCDQILDIFFAGRDTYKTFAASSNNIPYEEVTKAQRTFAKPAVLGGGYGMSGFALVSYAAGMGVTMEVEDGYRQVAAFREEYHQIPKYWENLEEAIRQAIRHPGQVFSVYAIDGWEEFVDPPEMKVRREYRYKDWPKVDYWYNGEFLYALLPSGRYLCYYKPHLADKEVTTARGTTFTVKDAIHYYGNDQKATGTKWQLISAHGGLFAENNTQALCRDAMWFGLEKAEADPWLEVIGDVYDEIMTLSDTMDKAALSRLISYITTRAPWMNARFFLGADGYMKPRYRK